MVALLFMISWHCLHDGVVPSVVVLVAVLVNAAVVGIAELF